MNGSKLITQIQTEQELDEAFSVFLFEGYYFLSDLEKIVAEAHEGKRILKDNRFKEENND